MRARWILALTRSAIGAIAWLAPDQAATMFGLRREQSSGYIMRLFGMRDLALGLALLFAPARSVRAVAVAGLAVDTADAVSGVLEGQRGAMDRKATTLATAGAVSAVVLGLATLWSSGRSTKKTVEKA